MPLTPQDQEYWRQKLGWRNFVKILGATSLMGCVIWPIFRFIMSYSAGHGGEWTVSGTANMIFANFLLALLVTTLIWCIGQIYSFMDWLPPRR